MADSSLSENIAVHNTGIYKITNTANGRCYVGSAVDIVSRFRVHKHHLRKGTHSNIYLQRAWNKYGKKVFEFTVLLFCSIEDLLFYEQRAIDTYHATSIEKGFNICPKAGNGLGRKWGENCEQGRKNISEANSGRVPWNKGKTGVYSEETLQRMSQNGKGKITWCTGKKLSEEHKRKLSESHKGIKRPPITEETRRKMSKAQKGKIISPETREKLSEAKKGKYVGDKNPFFGKTHSEETKQKIKEKRALQVFSPEARLNMGVAQKRNWKKRKQLSRRPVSEETRKKISEAGKGRIPWNKGLTADADPRVKKYVEANIGKVIPKEQREQIRAKLTGFKHSEEARKNMSTAQKTKAWASEDRREKLKDRLTGHPSGMVGKKHSDETRAKMREAHARRRVQLG